MTGNRSAAVARSLRLTPRPLIGLAIALRVPLVFRPLTYRGDAWRQADTASIARNYATGTFEPFKPQINWGGAGPGYVESELPVQPLLTSGLYRLFGIHEWLGRLVSLSFSALALVGVWLLAKRLLSDRAATIALAFVAFSPIFTRYSTNFMPEATTFALLVWALYLFDRWLDTPTWRLTVACGAATAFSVLAKSTALHLGLTFAVLLYLRGGWRRIMSKQAVALAVLATGPVAAWLVYARHLHLEYGNTFGVISGGDAKLGDWQMYTSISSYLPTGFRIDSLGITGIEIVAVFGIFTVPIFVAGLRHAIVDRLWIVPVGVAAVHVMYLGAIRYTSQTMGSQYHIHMLVFGGLAVGLGAVRLSESNGSTTISQMLNGIALVGFVAVSLIAYVDQFRQFREDEIACAATVASAAGPDELVAIVSDSPSTTDNGRFENNFQNPIIFYHADVRGWSVARDRFTVDEVVRLRSLGADWLVVPERELVAQREGMAFLLESLPEEGSPTGCAVYRIQP